MYKEAFPPGTVTFGFKIILNNDQAATREITTAPARISRIIR